MIFPSLPSTPLIHPSQEMNIEFNIMGDESDWESVDDFEANGSDGQVLVELPPGGIPFEYSAITTPPPGSSSSSFNSFSVVENIGGLTAQSHAGSSVSSYVNVASNASFSGQTLGSLVSNFEVISLASGETVPHCKRCFSRHPLGAAICSICYMALCANPCQGMDEQIALALQRQEEDIARVELDKRERQFQNLKDESPFNQAKFLTKELVIHLKGKKYLNLRVLPEVDLMFLALGFITNATETISQPSVSIAYKITNQSEWNNIRLNGFGGDERVKVVCMTVKDAIELKEETKNRGDAFFDTKEANPQSSTVLDSIPEGDSVEEPLENLWILIIVEDSLAYKSKVISTNLRILGSGNQVLPLACFDSHQSDGRSDAIGQLAHGLLQICCDFLRDGLQLGLTSEPTPPRKKLKASITQTQVQDLLNEPSTQAQVQDSVAPAIDL
jgi:hypothetical protein